MHMSRYAYTYIYYMHTVPFIVFYWKYIYMHILLYDICIHVCIPGTSHILLDVYTSTYIHTYMYQGQKKFAFVSFLVLYTCMYVSWVCMHTVYIYYLYLYTNKYTWCNMSYGIPGMYVMYVCILTTSIFFKLKSHVTGYKVMLHVFCFCFSFVFCLTFFPRNLFITLSLTDSVLANLKYRSILSFQLDY